MNISLVLSCNLRVFSALYLYAGIFCCVCDSFRLSLETFFSAIVSSCSRTWLFLCHDYHRHSLYLAWFVSGRWESWCGVKVVAVIACKSHDQEGLFRGYSVESGVHLYPVSLLHVVIKIISNA